MAELTKAERMKKFRNSYREAEDAVELASLPKKKKITTYIDQDIIDRLQEIASSEDGKYQTILNVTLRQSLFPSVDDMSAKITELQSLWKNLEDQKKQA